MKLPIHLDSHVIGTHSEAIIEHADAALTGIVVVQHGVLRVRVRTFDVAVHLELRHDGTVRGDAGGTVAVIGICQSTVIGGHGETFNHTPRSNIPSDKRSRALKER